MKGPRYLGIGLSAAGFVVSGVLEVVHAAAYLAPGAESFCTVGETLDCGAVALSRLSVIAGVPLPIWGAAGFLALGVAAHRRSRLLLPLAAVAALVSVALFIESFSHVGALCMLCEAVHVLALALLGVAWVGRKDVDRDTSLGRGALDVLLTPAALVLLTAFFAPRYWQPLTWQEGVPYPHGTDEDGQRWVGAETPEVTVVEYIDYGCPHCAVASNKMRMRLSRDADKLRVIRRHQPRTNCTMAGEGCGALRAALCADDQDKFWEMDSWLFVHVPGKAEVDFSAGAERIGLDIATFEACHTAPETYERAKAERAIAFKRRVRNTPSYVVDNKKVDVEQIHDLLDERL
jgi:uncharacterized membrane protein